MALQGKFLRFCNVLSNYRNCLGISQGFNNPSIQQIAGLRRSLEEKFNIPPKPKRPLTPYFRFMAKVRPEIKKDMPNAKVTDIVREVSIRWEKIDAQTKEKLEAEYRKEQEVYSKDRLNYDTQLTPDQKSVIKEATIKDNELREKRKLRQKNKEFNKPKKPCSTFVLFMKSQLANRGSKEFKQFQKEVAEHWQKLSDTEKKPFVEEAQKEMKVYQKQMLEWERKMIKLGNTDIVRNDALIEPKTKSHKKKRE